jgi:N-acetylmuramoyl-L-alanine amidase
VIKDTDPKLWDHRPPGVVIDAAVLHHTGGTNSLHYLQTMHEPKSSTHKLFARDGTIYKLVDELDRAWHAGVSDWGGRKNWNDFSIGYEIENTGTGKQAYTDAQYESVAQSLAYDCARFKIADYWVRDHKEIAMPRGRKTDPLGWDHKRMWDRVKQIRENWPYTDIPMWACYAD